MAGVLGNGPREAMGEEVDLVRLSKRKAVEEDSVVKVAKVAAEGEGAIHSEGALGSAREGAIGSETPSFSKGAFVCEGPSISDASKFPDIGTEEGFEESFDLDELEGLEMEYKVVEKTKIVKKQCEAVLDPLLVVQQLEAAIDDETKTTGYVMGQMANQMFTGMLKTLLDFKAVKK